MLIFDSKKGKFGTQKPKQWGPISAVQSSVFRNAERIGIDPDAITAYLPLWEGGGVPQPVVNSWDTEPVVPTWVDGGITNATAISGILSDRMVVPAKNSTDIKPFSMLSTIEFVSFGTESDVLIEVGATNSSTSFWGLSCSRLTENRFVAWYHRTGVISTYNTRKAGEITTAAITETPNLSYVRDQDGTFSEATANNYYDFDYDYRVISIGNTAISVYKIKQLLTLTDVVTQAQIEQLQETPFLLLEPVTPTFYSIPDVSGLFLIENSQHTTTSTPAAFAQGHQLSVGNGEHALDSTTSTFLQDHKLALNNSTHAVTSTNVTLTPELIAELIIQSAAQGMTSQAVSFAQVHSLLIASAEHATSDTGLTLTQIHDLLIADGVHTQTASNVVFELALALSIQSSTHAMSTSIINLSQEYLLAIQDAVSGLVSGPVDFTQDHNLVVSDSLHALLATQVNIFDEDTIIPTPDDRVFVVNINERFFVVAKEDRTYAIKAN